jgi:hypothetical protein
MNYRKTLINVWVTAVFHQIVIFLAVLRVLPRFGWHDPISGLLIIELLHLLWWFEIKKKFLDLLPEKFQYATTDPQNYLVLDIKAWNEYTEMLEASGFEQIMDFKIGASIGLSRLFVNSQNQVFVIIFKVFTLKIETIPIALSFLSRLNDGWILASTTSKPNGISHMWRDPKILRTSHSEVSIPELFQIHLQQRQEIMSDLGLSILPDISWQAYCRFENECCLRRRGNLKRKNILAALLQATLFELNPKNEWLGDYPKLAAKRKARGL